MDQLSLFGPGNDDLPLKPTTDGVVRLRMLVTVKAAPNPSEKYGETVCVAGVSAELQRPGWIRLYPINFRLLESDEVFRKYDIITVDAVPARTDPRGESWRPKLQTIAREEHLDPWKHRRQWLDPYLVDSMCALNREAKGQTAARSLALVRPREVIKFKVTPHEGWSPEEQRKVNAWVNQLDLLSQRGRTPLESPRFRGSYVYRCHEAGCRGHDQGLLDWEFVALQRRLRHLPDEELRRELNAKFFALMCAVDRDVAFFVGNQAKRPQTFSVLGVYYPKR